jgi:glycosyltransferase involved in cell wall biosynthesis
VTGFLVEPGSARALAERIAEVRAMPEDRLNAVRRAARRRYEESFTVERYRARIMEIIEGA